MKMKKISLVALCLGVCGVVLATDFKAPEFNEEYKVEDAAVADRGLASEPTDRVPSSVNPTESKKTEPNNESIAEPKPWLYQKGKQLQIEKQI